MTSTRAPGRRVLLLAPVLLVIAGLVVVSRGNDTAPPVSATPTHNPTSGPTTGSKPGPAREKSQSPQTWADTRLTPHEGSGWDLPDPLKAARRAWFAVAADHLDRTGEHVDPHGEEGSVFIWRTDGLLYPVEGRTGLVVDRDELDPFDGCPYLTAGPAPSNGIESCSDERFAGPGGAPATISRYQRLCESWDPGQEGDDARPGPGSTYATCGDFRVAVAVERRDGLIGYLVADGRGTVDHNPFTPEAMAAVAADSRLTLPNAAWGVPSNRLAASVLSDHFPGSRAKPGDSSPQGQPGYAFAAGRLGRTGLSMNVWAAGGSPVCGRSWLVHCVERRVYGADDPTTVFVGAWDEHDWADCCPRNSRAFSRQFVYVGPRHTVVVRLTRIVREHEDGIGAELDQRVIDLLLDPRLQADRR